MENEKKENNGEAERSRAGSEGRHIHYQAGQRQLIE